LVVQVIPAVEDVSEETMTPETTGGVVSAGGTLMTLTLAAVA
jgi:hypothetical protein